VTTPLISIQQFRAGVDKEIAVSKWILVSQEQIDSFARATGDEQFIHTDPARARESPYGGTVAHGFLVLSLISAMSTATFPAIERHYMSVNYGMDMVRFLSPVRAGKRVRGRFLLKDLIERAPGSWLSAISVTVEIEGEAKPALVAEWRMLTVLQGADESRADHHSNRELP
jgi:acyl dehydratase